MVGMRSVTDSTQRPVTRSCDTASRSQTQPAVSQVLGKHFWQQRASLDAKTPSEFAALGNKRMKRLHIDTK
jgi:hypothetical protein